jgi:ParB/RepB/Spo0J family partition protein
MKARQAAKDRAATLRREMEEKLHQLGKAAGQTPQGSEPVPIGNTLDVAAGVTAPRMVTEPIDITLIDPDPDQPRKFPAPFSPDNPGAGVEELAAGIQERGLLQPILVRRHQGRFRVLVGERRHRAYRLLDAREPGTWSHIPAIQWGGPVTAATLLAMQILENDQREDLDPASRREAYLRLKQLCSGNASQAIRMLGIGRITWYRVTGESDPDSTVPAATTRPKAASRLSFGQLTRALGTFEADRLQKLNPKQTDELEALLDRMLTLIRHRRAATEETPPPTG